MLKIVGIRSYTRSFYLTLAVGKPASTDKGGLPTRSTYSELSRGPEFAQPLELRQRSS